MLRAAVESDVAAMRAWRNQPTNRLVSIHSHEISEDEHAEWWERVRGDTTRRVLIFEHEGQPLGVVNFFNLDPAEKTGSWGFFLDHDTTSRDGTAMMAWIQVMREATSYAFNELGLEVLEGEVLEGNDAVRQMNRRFRFTEGEPEEREVGGQRIVVHPIRLRSEDHRKPREGRA